MMDENTKNCKVLKITPGSMTVELERSYLRHQLLQLVIKLSIKILSSA